MMIGVRNITLSMRLDSENLFDEILICKMINDQKLKSILFKAILKLNSRYFSLCEITRWPNDKMRLEIVKFQMKIRRRYKVAVINFITCALCANINFITKFIVEIPFEH